MEIVELGIVATDVIEALWMCRIRQSSPPEVYVDVYNDSKVVWY